MTPTDRTQVRELRRRLTVVRRAERQSEYYAGDAAEAYQEMQRILRALRHIDTRPRRTAATV